MKNLKNFILLFVKVNIPKSGSGAAGAPQGKDTDIVLFDWADVLFTPQRDSKGIKMVGSFQFKPGKYAIKIYGTSSSINLPRTSEGEEDSMGFTALPEFSHPGSPLEIEEFIQNMTNRAIGVAVRVGDCDGNEEPYYKVYGSKCNPLNLMAEGQDDNEGVKDLIKFQQFRKAKSLPGRYYGNFTFDEANLVPVDATAVDVANGSGEYQLQDNAAPTAILDLTNAAHEGTYTLLGSGGANPATIAAGGNFILAGAADWQGAAGARITLKAYEQAEGVFVFFEHSRSI